MLYHANSSRVVLHVLFLLHPYTKLTANWCLLDLSRTRCFALMLWKKIICIRIETCLMSISNTCDKVNRSLLLSSFSRVINMAVHLWECNQLRFTMPVSRYVVNRSNVKIGVYLSNVSMSIVPNSNMLCFHYQYVYYLMSLLLIS